MPDAFKALLKDVNEGVNPACWAICSWISLNRSSGTGTFLVFLPFVRVYSTRLFWKWWAFLLSEYPIDKAEFNFSEISGIYGRSQSFKFGSAGAVQLAVYNKTIQAKSIDKFDYIEHKWEESTRLSDGSVGYDVEQDVFRVELRYHHSVIQQFALGTCNKETGEIGVNLKTYSQIIRHIPALWQYGLTSFKLKYNSNYLDPIWTVLQEDIEFTFPESSYEKNLHYKRYYKKATSFSGKNYQL